MKRPYHSRDWLYKKYWTEKLSMTQISHVCRVDQGTIRKWMVRLGVSRRTVKQAQHLMVAKYNKHGRICSICDIYKLWSEFGGDHLRPMGKSNCCIECTRKRAIDGYHANHEHSLETARVRNQRRRARKLNAPGNLTQEDINLIYQVYGKKCMKCGATERLERDHVIPLSKGGSHSIGNIQILCKGCNSSKGATIVDYRNQTTH